MEKRFEQDKIKKYFPLCKNGKKVLIMNLIGHIIISNIIYEEYHWVRNSFMNHKTVDGVGFRADDLINCINKAKKLNFLLIILFII